MTLEEFGVIAQIVTPILLLVAGGVGWLIKRDFERAQRREERLREQAQEREENLRDQALQREKRLQDLEAKLRDERIEVYNTIIDPLAILYSKDENLTSQRRFNKHRGKNVPKEEIATEVMLSYEYKLAGFKLALFGSDEVVRAYGRLMQHAFKSANRVGDTENSYAFLELMGDFLIEIRRNVGNEETNLDIIEMFEWFVTDIDKVRATMK